MLEKIYEEYILKFPKLFLSLITLVMVVVGINITKLEIDASAQTLLLEGDKDLEFMRKVGNNFAANEFLIVTYTVKDDLLSEQNLENIRNISSDLEKLSNIQLITSILSVPLLQSPPKPLEELIKDIPTLQTAKVDKELVKKEFLNNPLYKRSLVSDDFFTTAIVVQIKRDEKYAKLIADEKRYIKLKQERELTKEEQTHYKKAQINLKNYRDIIRVENHDMITQIREILIKYESNTQAKLHLGGANMVADDMVEFVKSDLEIFGTVIVVLLMVILYILFRELRWVFLPLFISTVSIVITSGIFGALGWEITVVSSNFISLQLIMNISLVVHLIIKYKELVTLHPTYLQKDIVTATVISMAKPSFFVVITTIAGFSSLVLSHILPIINFGWMMSVGIVVSLVSTFLLFPILLLFLPKSRVGKFTKKDLPFTAKIAKVVFSYQKTILVVTVLVVIFSITGATQLRVENSFIDYFKKDTQIYQGMKLIDQKLGGTTPLDLVLTFKENSDEVESVTVGTDSLFDSFEDEFTITEDDKEDYWFTASKIEKIKQIHNYLESLEPVGKVLSLATLVEVGKSLNDGKELDGVTLALINKKLPEQYREVILLPYVSIKHNMARISTRVIDSQEGLQRDLLLKKIQQDVSQMVNPKYEEFKISNLLVIYNNLLQSLFDSQIKTIGVVLLILFVMFMVLFRDLKIAIVALIANTIPVGVIFGFMGWMNIPLDMMTITIAAISIGIAVDDTIHYIHRFNQEYKQTKDTKISIINAQKGEER
jgi:hypothetical protein